MTPEQVEVARWWTFHASDDTTVREGRARLAAVGVHDAEHLARVTEAMLFGLPANGPSEASS